MSLCGGAFLPTAFASANTHGGLSWVLFTTGSLIAGVTLMYSTFRIMKGIGVQERSKDINKWVVVSFMLAGGAALLSIIIVGGFRSY